jgi:hypothetical protein
VSQAIPDSISILKAVFERFDHLTILGRGPSAIDHEGRSLPTNSVLVTGPTYARRDVFAGEPVGVLIGTPPDLVDAIAKRFHNTPPPGRPVIMYTFLSVVAPFDFSKFDLQPIPIGPTLLNAGFDGFDALPYPTSGVFLMLLAAALGKKADVSGIDLYRHHSGRTYVQDAPNAPPFAWPVHHSLECDLRYIRRLMELAPGMFNISSWLQREVQREVSS